jgi:hypothetical protein
VHELNELRQSVGAPWTFLSDAGRKVQRDLEIQEYTDPHHDPMIPHTLVLEPGLIVFSIYDGYWYWGRPSMEDLRRDLRDVTRKVRPDWDLTAAGVRAAWERGDRSRHYPYVDDGELERARDPLDRFIAEQLREEAAEG